MKLHLLLAEAVIYIMSCQHQGRRSFSVFSQQMISGCTHATQPQFLFVQFVRSQFHLFFLFVLSMGNDGLHSQRTEDCNCVVDFKIQSLQIVVFGRMKFLRFANRYQSGLGTDNVRSMSVVSVTWGPLLALPQQFRGFKSITITQGLGTVQL